MRTNVPSLFTRMVYSIFIESITKMGISKNMSAVATKKGSDRTASSPKAPATPSWHNPETEARIRELFQQGLSGTRIASILGISKNAVLRRLHIWGLRNPSPSPRASRIWSQPDNIQKLIALRKEGKSATYIARVLGVSKNSVLGKIHRLKEDQKTNKTHSPYKDVPDIVIASPRPSFWADPARVERLKDLWQAGVPTRRIAEILGTTQRAVRHKAEHLGLPRRAAPLPSSRHRHERAPSPADQTPPTTSSETFAPSSSDATLPTILRGTGCRWPLWGDHEEPTHRYCGKPTIALWPGVYCPECRAKALSRSSIAREHETVQ